ENPESGKGKSPIVLACEARPSSGRNSGSRRRLLPSISMNAVIFLSSDFIVPWVSALAVIRPIELITLMRKVVARPDRRCQNNIAAGFPIEGADLGSRPGVPEAKAGNCRVHFLISTGNNAPFAVNRAAQAFSLV